MNLESLIPILRDITLDAAAAIPVTFVNTFSLACDARCAAV